MNNSAFMVFRSAIWRRARTCAWLFVLLVANIAQGEGAREFLIQNWTHESGLPGNTVTAVEQTPDGYIWAGTLSGLARFDGVRFVSVDLRKLGGLQDTAVVSLYTDPQGILWVGTAGGYLVRCSGGHFTSFLPPSRQTTDRPLRRMVKAKDGALWMLNYEGVLSRLEGGVFTEVTNRRDFVTLSGDANERVWVAGQKDLLVSEAGQLSNVWNTLHEPGFQPEAVAVAREGGCWIAGNGCIRRFEDGQFLEKRAVLPAKQSPPSALVEDHEGNLWLASYGGGVLMCDKRNKIKQLTRQNGLPSDLVRCLFEDHDGNIWAGLEGRGLICIRQSMFASYGKVEGLSGETVLCVCEGEEGEVWIGTNGDGVHRIKDGHIQHFRVSEGLVNPFVWALYKDHAGRLWAGTWGGGLFKFEKERFVETREQFGETPVVLAVHEDARGALWLGQRIADDRRIEAIVKGRRIAFPVPGDSPRIDVRSIAETPDGSVWFGTMEQGLFRWKDGAFERCGAEQGLPSGPISALHVDDDGALWVGVAGIGLVLWEKERFHPVNVTPGLLDDNLNQISDDGQGYLWCGARNGVVRVKREDLLHLARGEHRDLEWRRFSKSDGLPSNECSGLGCRTRNGRIWFSTAAGVAVVNPRHIVANPPPPPVVIEEVLLVGKRPQKLGDIQEKSAASGRTLVSFNPLSGVPVPRLLKIPPGGGPLDIRYTALSFAAPERVRFRHQLVGLDESPVEAGSARVVRYSFLPPGNYEFRVTACNEGDVWNESGASLALVVLPHYWQTWWFRLAGVCTMLGATAVSARFAITRRLRRRLANLEQQRALEAERSRIAQDLHDDLGTSLTEINFLSAMAGSPSSSPAEIRSSLDSINEKSLELVKALDEIVWAVNPKNDSLRNLVNYLCLFAQDYVRPAAIQCRLDVSPGLPDLPLNAEQRHTLFLVTKEALANAAKHSTASELRLRVALENSVLKLVIEDNGRGFDEAALKGDRNGLWNIESRMRHLGGRGVIRSALTRGTCVELELPLR